MWNNDPNLTPGAFLVKAEDIEVARVGTDQYYRERYPEKVKPLDYWYHLPLSPTGEQPPTHYMCYAGNMSDSDWKEQTDYLVEHNLPVATERVPELSIWEYAASKGLKRIEAK